MSDETTQPSSQDMPTPWDLVKEKPDSRLNIVFDIDHTLIFTIPFQDFPPGVDNKEYLLSKLEEDPKIDPSWQNRVHKIFIGPQKFPMWLIVRFGVAEMLEYLSTFCKFYVYSHGLKAYIAEILKKLDPEEKYFLNREETVLAPVDQKHQHSMVMQRKGIQDLKDPRDQRKPLLSKEEVDKAFIIDDQIGAIRDGEHLIVSKKFLKFYDLTRYQDPRMREQKMRNWNNFQFPEGNGQNFPISDMDYTHAHKELNKTQEHNQLYSICNLITRIYLIRTLLQPTDSVQKILQTFRKEIFQGHVFSFSSEFLSGCNPSAIDMTSAEQTSAKQYKKACQGLVIDLGGKVTDKNFQASHIVVFQEQMLHQRLNKLQNTFRNTKFVNFRYITECYFQTMRIDLESESGAKYLIKGVPR